MEVKERRNKGKNVALINGMIRSFPGKPNTRIESQRPQESRLFPGRSATQEDSERQWPNVDGRGSQGPRPVIQ